MGRGSGEPIDAHLRHGCPRDDGGSVGGGELRGVLVMGL